jgi:hypothetical protein
MIRKLLWEKMSSGQIAALKAGRETGDLKKLLLEGIRCRGDRKSVFPFCEWRFWKRVLLAPGVELYLELPLRDPLTKEAIDRMGATMRRHL